MVLLITSDTLVMNRKFVIGWAIVFVSAHAWMLWWLYDAFGTFGGMLYGKNDINGLLSLSTFLIESILLLPMCIVGLCNVVRKK